LPQSLGPSSSVTLVGAPSSVLFILATASSLLKKGRGGKGSEPQLSQLSASALGAQAPNLPARAAAKLQPLRAMPESPQPKKGPPAPMKARLAAAARKRERGWAPSGGRCKPQKSPSAGSKLQYKAARVAGCDAPARCATSGLRGGACMMCGLGAGRAGGPQPYGANVNPGSEKAPNMAQSVVARRFGGGDSGFG
jgi:hypothetical protein